MLEVDKHFTADLCLTTSIFSFLLLDFFSFDVKRVGIVFHNRLIIAFSLACTVSDCDIDC